MQTTATSTTELEAKIAASLPPAYAALAFSLFDDLERRRTPKPGRVKNIAELNRERAARVRDGIKQAAGLLSLHDIPPCHRVSAVRNFLLGRLASFGLTNMPAVETVHAVIDELLEENSTPVSGV